MLLAVKETEKKEALLRTCHRSLNSCGRVRVTPAACGYAGRETSFSSRVFRDITFAKTPNFSFNKKSLLIMIFKLFLAFLLDNIVSAVFSKSI
jgi:hypothetical protein